MNESSNDQEKKTRKNQNKILKKLMTRQIRISQKNNKLNKTGEKIKIESVTIFRNQ